MTNLEEHTLRIQYLDVLLKNGLTLNQASEYFDEIMKFDEVKKTAQQASLQQALEQTSLGNESNEQLEINFVGDTQEMFDFTNTEQEKQFFPDMVYPGGDTTIENAEVVRPTEGIQEKTSTKMGSPTEQIPLRYEDRVKQFQK